MMLVLKKKTPEGKKPPKNPSLRERPLKPRHSKNVPSLVSHTDPAEKVPEIERKALSQPSLVEPSAPAPAKVENTALVKPEDLTALGTEYVPPLACDRCDNSSVCPLFRAGYECGFAHILEKVSLKDPGSRERTKRELAEAQIRRTIMAIIKDINSGTESEGVDAKIQNAIMLINNFEREGGTPEQKQSILQMLFQFGGTVEKPEVKDAPPITASCEVIK